VIKSSASGKAAIVRRITGVCGGVWDRTLSIILMLTILGALGTLGYALAFSQGRGRGLPSFTSKGLRARLQTILRSWWWGRRRG